MVGLRKKSKDPETERLMDESDARVVVGEEFTGKAEGAYMSVTVLARRNVGESRGEAERRAGWHFGSGRMAAVGRGAECYG